MNKRYQLTILLLLMLLFLLGCRPATTPPAGTAAEISEPGEQRVTLNVFAAASLTDAFREIGETFRAANPGTEVVFSFAGSNQLAIQIAEGAPADLFASANPAQMTAAIESGRIESGTQQIFAHNRLVVITPSDNPAGIASLQDLAKPGVKIIFAAEEVPVGRYTLTFLDRADADGALGVGYRDAVLANVVSYEANVRAVLTKIVLGEGDAGIVYTSDVGSVAVDQAEAVLQIEIPDELNTIAVYPIAPLADSAHKEMAQEFVAYVLASEGQQVLTRYGFIPISSLK